MEFLAILGLLAGCVTVALIEHPKLITTARKNKYIISFYSVLAFAFVLGVLDIFKLVPDYHEALIAAYKLIFNLE